MTDFIKFQVLDWIDNSKSYDEVSEDDDPDEPYLIQLFGRTDKNETICCNLTDFYPYFYIKLQNEWTQTQIEALVDKIKSRVKFSYKEGLRSFKIESHYDLYGFTNFKKFNFLRLEFINDASFKAYNSACRYKFFIKELSINQLKLKVYESNLNPFLRMMHIMQIRSVGWIQIDPSRYKIKSKSKSATTTDLNVTARWSDISALDTLSSQKFKILSFDLECKSDDGSFPNPDNKMHPIIQIGMTISLYGESECVYKHILCLKETAPLDGIIVESFNEEKDVLLRFTELIIKLDPDIITGYNIFGFDFQYLYKRARLLGIETEFSKLSRIKNESCRFIETVLASSALGENILKYYRMTGRVVVDLMKVIQRDYRLGSYKLDEVASNFIRESIQDIQVTENRDESMIFTKNTDGLYIGHFIKICYSDGMTENKHMDGMKFKVISLTNKTILVTPKIETDEIMNRGYKIFWTQSKDDISPNDIFRMQDGTPLDRSVIAKYCIQDCALCNKLISKLQIITNNMGMAIVCHVPLSYLFLRGQGIKIFSLVAKKCRELNHLIPVLKKKKKVEEPTSKDAIIAKETEKILKSINNKYSSIESDEDDDDDTGYEGATVFNPVQGFHKTPIPVLDFSSLYPNAMRLKNLSHEMFVNDSAYLNLPGYIYHRIEYKSNDGTGTSITCIFAEKTNGEKGIIPQILSELLGARKKYKNQMEDLKENGGDSFNIAILDGLQLAYKVTANSLYGQTGAPTSQIYLKAIAASTTSIGRQMLIFSKYFIEVIFKKLINLAKSSYEDYLTYCRETFKYYPSDIQVDEQTLINVETQKNKIIPDSKFLKSNLEFYIESYEGLTKKYSSELKLLNLTNKELYDEFMQKLINLNQTNKDSLYKIMSKLKELFSFDKNKLKYNPILNLISIDKERFFELSKLTISPFFIDDLLEPIMTSGYTNQLEMFDKFYQTVQYTLKNLTVNPTGIYGDTDSIFYCLNIKNSSNEDVLDKPALRLSIKFGIWSSILITTLLPPPMAQEYEKVLWPFIIITKKRYVGNLYEKSPDKFYQKSMGIVLKRRDNANVVKIVCGNIVDQLLNKQDALGAIKKTQDLLKQIIMGKMPLDKFIITKTLKSTYKDRTRMVHAVLADRMAMRDPGNKPQSNDRIPYAYVQIDKDPKYISLQGERVEHPDYIIEKSLRLDYNFYITNQIMKPCLQFLDLIVEDANKIFEDFLIKDSNWKSGQDPITKYLSQNNSNNISFDDFTTQIEQQIKQISRLPEKEIKNKKKTVKKINISKMNFDKFF
jgi:DNA polymerase elongation subunit (family B)